MRTKLLFLAMSCFAMLFSARAARAEGSPAAEALGKHGVREIVFAERAFGRDGHWYANFAYFFDDTKNADYQAILKMIEQVKVCLDKNKRWDMPGFKPHPYYVREMKRYGILSEAFDVDRDKIDIFELDRRYWESFWYYPKGGGPKLYPNKKMHSMLISPKPGIPWAKDLTKIP